MFGCVCVCACVRACAGAWLCVVHAHCGAHGRWSCGGKVKASCASPMTSLEKTSCASGRTSVLVSLNLPLSPLPTPQCPVRHVRVARRVCSPFCRAVFSAVVTQGSSGHSVRRISLHIASAGSSLFFLGTSSLARTYIECVWVGGCLVRLRTCLSLLHYYCYMTTAT